MVRLRKLEKAKKKSLKSLSPPSRPPRVGDKFLTLTHRRTYIVPGTTKIRITNDSESSDSDETPDEDQSIPYGIRGDDDDVDESTPAAGGGNNDDDDGDQDMPAVGEGNDDDDDGNGGKGESDCQELRVVACGGEFEY
ncbi:uncharacterized protein LOC113279669 [Papaver somniferum]|uniref:uncharacterized protein LOC113279669 n=1 Tax=Papaver somniferum TaxID=3469 RepID=UPI000E700899|nr:uncharacterized protein LOC113279669 [Papaver somniferum]